VVTTPHQNRINEDLFKASDNMNMTGGFSQLKKSELDFMNSTSKSFMEKGNISIEDPGLETLPEENTSASRTAIS
jgi:hypothetical protein